MDKHQQDEDRVDKKYLNQAMMNDLDDDTEDEDDTQDDGGVSGILNKGTNAAKGILNGMKKSVKLVANIVKVIAKLPPQVQAIIYTVLLGIIVALIVDVTKTEASSEVTSSVNYTVSNMSSKLEDENVSQEEKTKIEKAIKHFEEDNSYLYFRISDINDAYENFKEEYENATGDVSSKSYASLSQEYGTVDLNDTTSTSRLVDSEQKLPLFKHLLMTEKYNFNKVKWEWYGHGHNGEDIPSNNFVNDTELGLKYPSDQNSTEIETFIKLLSPYMQTWHIPLATHSAFLTKSGSSDTASKFTYSVIKNTYSDILVHRYDIQKYTLNTKFDDYMRKEYKSKFNIQIEVTKKYVPQVERIIRDVTIGNSIEDTVVISETPEMNYETIMQNTVSNYCSTNSNCYLAIMNGNYVDKESTFANVNTAGVYYAIYSDRYENGKVILKKYTYDIHFTTTGEKSFNSRGGSEVNVDPVYNLEPIADEAVRNYISSNSDWYKGVYNSDGTLNKEETFGNVVESGNYTCIWRSVSPMSGTYTIRKTVFYVDVRTSSVVYKTDSNGNIIYDATYKYKYLSENRSYNQELISERYDNTRKEGDPLTVDKSSSSVPINPMLEEKISDETSITNKYYIKDAKTFDVKFANTFNYIKYSETDAQNRVNPKSESETDLEKFYADENIENKIDTGNINIYINNGRTLNEVENDSRISITVNQFKTAEPEAYEMLKNSAPNQEVTKTTTITSGLLDSATNSRTDVDKYTNKYEATNTYVIKEGLPENNQGTHYITRKWEDSLTQNSATKELYTVDDLVEFNANYNSKLNGTDKSTEETDYKELLEKDSNSNSNYEALEADSKLNNIYFINSNSNIFEEYLIDVSPEGTTTGYNNQWLKLALDEIKSLFSETVDDTGKIPYVYGISLGITNLLEDASKQQLNSNSGIFGWPTDNEYISAIQGYSFVYGKEHDGVDIWATYDGDNKDYSSGKYPVYAVADGEIIVANDLGIISDSNMTNINPLGNFIAIKHDNGYISTYGHLFTGTFTVSTGDRVERGQEIAKIGSSGNSSCLHLHYNIYDNSNGDDTWVGDPKLDPLEFYRIETTEINTIEYAQLLQDTSLREQINQFNMYKYAGSIGNGDVLAEPLPTLTDTEKSELVNELSSTYMYGKVSDTSKLWVLQYYADNPIELLARAMYAELVVTDINDEGGVYAVVAQTKAAMGKIGSADNVYHTFTETGYLAPTTYISGNFLSDNIPQFYRQIAAAALDGTLPNPPGFTGNERYWIGAYDTVRSDGTSNHFAYNNNCKQTCGFQTSGGGFHVFLTPETDAQCTNILVPSGGRFTLNDSYEISDGVYVDPSAGGSTQRNYDEIIEILNRY